MDSSRKYSNFSSSGSGSSSSSIDDHIIQRPKFIQVTQTINKKQHEKYLCQTNFFFLLFFCNSQNKEKERMECIEMKIEMHHHVMLLVRLFFYPRAFFIKSQSRLRGSLILIKQLIFEFIQPLLELPVTAYHSFVMAVVTWLRCKSNQQKLCEFFVHIRKRIVQKKFEPNYKKVLEYNPYSCH